MSRDDLADFKAHPEWFTAKPLRPCRPSPEDWGLMPEAAKSAYLDAQIRPALIFERKPVPFVLPIRGAG